MKIETKFDIGQAVWCVDNSKAKKIVITNIEISIAVSDETPVYISYSSDNEDLYYIVEENLFLTKQELLESL